MSLLPYAVGFGFIAVLGALAYKFYTKGENFYCNALFYEKIGSEEIFRGLRIVDKITTNTVICLKIRGEPKSFFDIPSSKDFFHTENPKLKKIIHITKYGERDYRVKKRLNKRFYEKINAPLYDEKIVFDKDLGEEVAIKEYKKNEQGNYIYEVSEKRYSEPLGVDQEGRDAIRVSLQNEIEINKHKNQEGFWDRWGGDIIRIGSVLIVALMIMKVSGDVSNSASIVEASCKDAKQSVDDASKKIDNPHWAKDVLSWVQTRNDEDTSPPS